MTTIETQTKQAIYKHIWSQIQRTAHQERTKLLFKL